MSINLYLFLLYNIKLICFTIKVKFGFYLAIQIFAKLIRDLRVEKLNATTPPVGDYAVRVWQIENRLDGAEYYRGKQLANSITLGDLKFALAKTFCLSIYGIYFWYIWIWKLFRQRQSRISLFFSQNIITWKSLNGNFTLSESCTENRFELTNPFVWDYDFRRWNWANEIFTDLLSL